MTNPDPKPTTHRGGNTAWPEWDRIPDEDREPEDEPCDDCDGRGETMRSSGYDTCRGCRGTGVATE